MKPVNQEPITYGDVAKLLTWLVTFGLALGYLNTDAAEELKELIPALVPLVFALGGTLAGSVQAVIAYMQRNRVTWWQPENPLVNYVPESQNME